MQSASSQTAADRAEELPGTYLDFPFGPDWEVYKVHGKVFMLQTTISGEPITILKAAPEDSVALSEGSQQP